MIEFSTRIFNSVEGKELSSYCNDRSHWLFRWVGNATTNHSICHMALSLSPWYKIIVSFCFSIRTGSMRAEYYLFNHRLSPISGQVSFTYQSFSNYEQFSFEMEHTYTTPGGMLHIAPFRLKPCNSWRFGPKIKNILFFFFLTRKWSSRVVSFWECCPSSVDLEAL